MRRQTVIFGVVLVVALVWSTAAFGAGRGIDFRPLGYVDQEAPFPFSAAYDISGDGKIITGGAGFGGGCAVWTSETGWEYEQYIYEGYLTTTSCKISQDGSTLVASIPDETFTYGVGAKWNGSEWVPYDPQPGFEPCGGSGVSTYDVSGDGSTIGGLTWEGCSYARGYNYTDATGVDVMEGILDDSSRINGVNYDGSISVGWNRIDWGGWKATRWDNGVASWVGGDPDVWQGSAWAVTPDGSTIVGEYYPEGFYNQGWIWTEEGGTQGTGWMPWAWFLDAGNNFDVSHDGNVVVGRFGSFWGYVGTLWTPETGLLDLNQFMIDQGRTEVFEGWLLLQGSAVTADGTKIAGYAVNPDFYYEAFILDISRVYMCKPLGDTGEFYTDSNPWSEVADNLTNGALLGTCEALGAGGVRASELEAFTRLRSASSRMLQNSSPQMGGSLEIGDPMGLRRALGLDSKGVESIEPIEPEFEKVKQVERRQRRAR